MLKVGVIFGGTSSEREISLMTGNEMLKNLNKCKYCINKIEINNNKDLINSINSKQLDFVLLALHGKFGEDGTAQAILEGLNVPYSGSGMVSSSLCMNKDIAKRLMVSSNINTPTWTTVKKSEELNYELFKNIGYPLVVKPSTGGSSIGTFIVQDDKGIVDAILKAFQYDDEIIIEKYIEGTEITCSILNGVLLPCILIKPKADFFDLSSKYENLGAEETVVNLQEDLYSRIKTICSNCWDLFKCEVYARIDIIIKDDKPYVLEINTLPGMTPNSLFPKSAEAVGISFGELLDIIIESSMKIKR